MTSEITFNIDTGLNQRFQMALQLNEEHADQVIEAMLKSYIARTFSQAAASYTDNSSPKLTPPNDTNYAKAIHRIPKWANKPTQINHKIIRAYLQLAEMGEVTYNQLARQCTNHEDHPDVYVPTFSSNFAQMKFDGDKSHGKVFDVAPDGHVTIWREVESCLRSYKQKFLVHTTDIGYTNDNLQTNLGRTEYSGTDHMQHLYKMRCGNCGHEYHANGSDIFQKKCPRCQGGANTSMI